MTYDIGNSVSGWGQT